MIVPFVCPDCERTWNLKDTTPLPIKCHCTPANSPSSAEAHNTRARAAAVFRFSEAFMIPPGHIDWREACRRKIDCSHETLARIDFATVQSYRQSLVDMHNRIEARRGRPTITLDEVHAIYDPLPGKGQPLPIVTALSLMPGHIDRQTTCLDSWVRSGYEIHAQNTAAELKILRPLYPQVDCWHVCDRVSDGYAYPTQLIWELLGLTRKLDRPVMLVNSDVEVRSPQTFDHNPGATTLGIRWDYEEGYADATEFRWGIDALTIDQEQHAALPPDIPLAIGQAMWDYAIPYLLACAGYRLDILHRRQFFHQMHKQNWHQEAWEFSAAYMKAHGYEIATASSHRFRDTMETYHFWSETLQQYLPLGSTLELDNGRRELPGLLRREIDDKNRSRLFAANG